MNINTTISRYISFINKKLGDKLTDQQIQDVTNIIESKQNIDEKIISFINRLNIEVELNEFPLIQYVSSNELITGHPHNSINLKYVSKKETEKEILYYWEDEFNEIIIKSTKQYDLIIGENYQIKNLKTTNFTKTLRCFMDKMEITPYTGEVKSYKNKEEFIVSSIKEIQTNTKNFIKIEAISLDTKQNNLIFVWTTIQKPEPKEQIRIINSKKKTSQIQSIGDYGQIIRIKKLEIEDELLYEKSFLKKIFFEQSIGSYWVEVFVDKISSIRIKKEKTDSITNDAPIKKYINFYVWEGIDTYNLQLVEKEEILEKCYSLKYRSLKMLITPTHNKKLPYYFGVIVKII